MIFKTNIERKKTIEKNRKDKKINRLDLSPS